MGIDKGKDLSDQRRRFIVSPKRGGLLIITTMTEQEYASQESMIEVFTRLLPHRGAMPPLVSHKAPAVPGKEKNTIIERMNRAAIDKRTLS
jgi:hypothetical protein